MKRAAPSPLLLSPRYKQYFYGATVLLWLSGAAWFYLDEANSLRPLWMKIHGAAAMVFLILFGMLFSQHIPAGLRQDRQRLSGISLWIVCGVLIVSGWGLYYIGSEAGRHSTSEIHTVLGLALPALLAIHIFQARPK